MAFVANGLSYFAVIASLLRIKVPPRQAHERRGGGGGLREAFAYLRGERVVRACIGFTALSTTFMFPVFVIFSAIFIKDVLHGSSRDFGIFMSASGLGAMTGALMLLRISAEQRGRLMMSVSVVAAGLLLLQSFSRSVALAALVQVCLTFTISIGMGLASTIVQVLVPPSMRGRVMGLSSLSFTGIMPSAALILGAIGDQIGLRAVMRLCAVAYAALVVPWLAAAGLWRRVAHHPPETAIGSQHA
jgi:predicted MFS family arabinose efflux permease